MPHFGGDISRYKSQALLFELQIRDGGLAVTGLLLGGSGIGVNLCIHGVILSYAGMMHSCRSSNVYHSVCKGVYLVTKVAGNQLSLPPNLDS